MSSLGTGSTYFRFPQEGGILPLDPVTATDFGKGQMSMFSTQVGGLNRQDFAASAGAFEGTNIKANHGLNRAVGGKRRRQRKTNKKRTNRLARMKKRQTRKCKTCDTISFKFF